jgi:dienelactone hydrolase
MRMLPLLLLLGCACGCHHSPAATFPRSPPGPDVPTPAYYDAGGTVPEPLSRELTWRRRGAIFERIELPPRLIPAVAEVPLADTPIEILWMRPFPETGEPRPLILMSPLLGNSRLLMCDFATAFVRQGFNAAVVMRKDLQFDPERSLRLAEEEVRIVVMRARQALDWLVEQPGVDATRLGMFGISAGGILGVDMLAADPRLGPGVFIWAGAPMADVLVDTVEDRMADDVRLLIDEHGWTRERLRKHLRARIRTDPIKLAPRIRREDVLLFTTTDDDSVPTRYQEALWRALGEPERHELLGGHYTATAAFFPFLIVKTQAFFRSRLSRGTQPRAPVTPLRTTPVSGCARGSG